jgi:hypothetical protein
MATTLTQLEALARVQLKEPVASFWSSADLVAHINTGIKDLWGAIVDLHQEHFLTVDETNVSLAAEASSLTGVPTDCFRVHLIEQRDTTTGPLIKFTPRDYNSDDFINARSRPVLESTAGARVCYTLSQAGAPVGAPTVHTAPRLSTAVLLRFVYVPVIAAKVAADNNPIPGESDNALVAWCVAYARAKEREDRSPDPAWLAIYRTEKANLLTRLTPRQTQEPDVVEDLWAGYM